MQQRLKSDRYEEVSLLLLQVWVGVLRVTTPIFFSQEGGRTIRLCFSEISRECFYEGGLYTYM